MQIERIAKQLNDATLGKADRRQLEQKRGKLEQKLDGHVKFFATWWLSSFKFQRHLYYRYGGGRVPWQQAGLEAFDAMHRWLTENEEKGDFKITDPDLRAKFYEYWTTMRNGAFLSKEKDRIDPRAFEYPWVKEPATKRADPLSEKEETTVGVFDRSEAKEIVLRDNKCG